ncbi:MAG TPA: oligosaccharide flippase family protein [Candidatus Cloacimonadota bacterium]|nr:oligosaccharide flippase family protein [Candidatus Cloacimonadota bacterium]
MNQKLNHLLINQFRQLWDKGFYHIFGASFLNKIIQFCASVLLVRIISKPLYGVWTYAENILQFFLLLQGLGCVVGLLQFSSANHHDISKKYAYTRYTLIIGIIVNSMIAFSIIMFYFFGKLAISESKQVLLFLCFFPLVNVVFDTLQIYFRSSFENKKFSLLTTVNSATFLIFSTSGAVFWGIYGIAVGRYMAVLISVVTGFYLLKPQLHSILKAKALSVSEKKEFLSFSVVSMFSNIFSSLLFLLDVFLIGLLLKDKTLVASYKIATIIPFAMNFLPMTILIYAYPYLVQSATDCDKVKKVFNKLITSLAIVNSFISLFCIIFAPMIIKIIFGRQFLDAVPSFRILMLAYFVIGTFRSPAGNTLNALKKVNYNLIIVIVTGFINIALDYFLIKLYGMQGAAITSLTVSVLSSIMAMVFIRITLKSGIRPTL